MNFHITGESSTFSADTGVKYFYYKVFAEGKLIGKIVHNIENDTFDVAHSAIDIGDGNFGWLFDTVDSMAEAIRYIKQDELV